ncbi:hypothetical protein [Stutzerimonas stutzeri]|uniref:DUF115 domain-containing protein n=1 Tax=Stutzerimonas stutzeri TaxID=316 RepID=A0A0D7E2X1_STUST|nr:hypothetical protein [Stutzerimonas stutzeri]KIZ35199.1 hypothetical protein LO50_14350 [Stutzerimonas stutzeri]
MDMQKKIYYLLKAWTPPRLLPLVLKGAVLLRYLLLRDKAVLKKNSRLKEAAVGRDAYLLATGPSLKGIDLGFLEGKDCFSVSNFMLHPQLNEVCPKLHFFAPYHEPLIFEEYVSWLRQADAMLPASTGIVLGLQTKGTVEKYGLFRGREVHYLCLEKVSLTSVPDITCPVVAPQTSPIMVLPVLHYMGYKRVFLLGCDHNILKNYGGVVENFYSADQDARKNATSGDNWRDGIVKHLENALNVFAQYMYYKKVFSGSGRELKHTSKEGWLDFLEYTSLDELRLAKVKE